MKSTDQDQRDLSKALGYANWAALGLIVPFIGWLLAGMALSYTKTIPVTDQTRGRIKQVKNAAWTAIVISSLSMGAWAWYYNHQRQEAADRERAKAVCIDAANVQADIAYNTSYRTNMASNALFASIEQTRAQSIAACEQE